jgi:DNA polymerase-3 subunit gamma/tau
VYQALYLKSRPLVFGDVRGQDHITVSLRRQSEQGRLSHAYLFIGSRGTGKTTCARILARAACCESLSGGDPCNKCPACESILSESAVDVVEIDGATYTGVDDIRAVRDELAYTPAALRRKVYIIDEVHMLSVSAFNALLKSLEEPPPHVLFILATTEPHKLPATVVSRCQRFRFARLSPEIIADRLQVLAKTEGAVLAPDAAALLAESADGSMRDGISLLDQCLAASGGLPVDTPSVRKLLGLTGSPDIRDWLGLIIEGNTAAALAKLDEMYAGGAEPPVLLEQLALLLRSALMDALRGKAAALPAERAVDMLTQLRGFAAGKTSGIGRRIDAELCVIKLCSLAAAPTVPPAARTEPPPSAPAPAAESAARTQPAPAPPAAERPAPPPGDILSRVAAEAGPLCAGYLESARIEETPSGLRVTVYDEFAAKMLRESDFTARLAAKFPGEHRVIAGEPPAPALRSLDALAQDNKGIVTEI